MPASEPVQLQIDARKLVWRLAAACVAVEIGLIVLDYQLHFAGVHVAGSIRRLANMTREDSLANLAAVIQVTFLALTLWGVFLTLRGQGGTAGRRRGWLVLALFFSYMVVDDGSSLHERVGTAVELVLKGWRHADLFPSYTWQLLYLPVFALLGLFTLYFLWRELEPQHSRLLVVAGILCFVVAVGMDFLEGLDEQSPFNPYRWLADHLDIAGFTDRRFHTTPHHTVLHFSKVLEEAIEMLGITLIWVAVLRHWTRAMGELRLRLSAGDPT